MFSWNRQKGPKQADQEEGKEATPIVFTQAPFGVYPPSSQPSWATESDSNFNLEALVEAPEPVSIGVNKTDVEDNGEEAEEKKPLPRKKRFETENSVNFKWPNNVSPAPTAKPSNKKSQIVFSNEESAATLPTPPIRNQEEAELLSFGYRTSFVSEMSGRYVPLNTTTVASRGNRHKNHSDPYLLAHHDVTLDQVVEDAINELEQEGDGDGDAVDTEDEKVLVPEAEVEVEVEAEAEAERLRLRQRRRHSKPLWSSWSRPQAPQSLTPQNLCPHQSILRQIHPWRSRSHLPKLHR